MPHLFQALWARGQQRQPQSGPGVASSVRQLPADLKARVPGHWQRLEHWTGEGAAFARYRCGSQALFLKYLPPPLQQPRPFRRLRRELLYLRDLAPLSPVPHAPLLHGAVDAPTHRAHLLTRDLTDETLGWGAFQTDEAREGALHETVRLLARHHAFWWNHHAWAQADPAGEWVWNAERVLEQGQQVAWQVHYPAVVQAAAQLPHLLADLPGLTLAHGDIHAGQVLWPRVGGAPVLIDYGQVQAAPLGYDLAHLLGTRLDPPDRVRLGPALRDSYAAELETQGLRLRADVLTREERLGLALNVLSVARQQGREPASEGLKLALERVLDAWVDTAG